MTQDYPMTKTGRPKTADATAKRITFFAPAGDMIYLKTVGIQRGKSASQLLHDLIEQDQRPPISEALLLDILNALTGKYGLVRDREKVQLKLTDQAVETLLTALEQAREAGSEDAESLINELRSSYYGNPTV